MERLALTPLPSGTVAQVTVPGSKSYTNRALVLAAITPGAVKIKNALICDDTIAMLNCLRQLGTEVEIESTTITINSNVTSITDTSYELNAGLSGTTMRFMLALAAVIPGQQTLRGGKGLENRPIGNLVSVLRSLGAKIEYLGKDGFPPLTVSSSKLSSGKTLLSGAESSQYLSAVLMIAPLVGELEIEIVGELISKPYIDMTISIMDDFGVEVSYSGAVLSVKSGQKYHKKQFCVEGDFSSAAYFFAIAALTKSTITVKNLNLKSTQADKEFVFILEKMGNKVKIGNNQIMVAGQGVKSLEVNMQNCPDQAQTLAVLAAFADGTTRITGIQSLRVKETERVVAIEAELAKMGIATDSTKDSLTIYGGQPKSARIATYGDHRMAMSFAVAGSHIPGMVIEEPSVVTKTFPDFWKLLSQIGISSSSVEPNIVLIGMRGTGKSTIGRLLANRFGREHIDLDDVMTSKLGMSTTEIVKKHGWDFFRKQESKIVASFADISNKVISTGGGVILDEKNIKVLTNMGRVIWLKASSEVLAKRRANEKSERPALTDKPNLKSEISTVLDERGKLYESTADLTIETDDLSAEEVVNQLTLCSDFDIPAGAKLCVVIGDPVKHSLSPSMHNAGYEALGIADQFQFRALQVSPDQLKTFVGAVRSLNIRGVSVTIPHKVAIMPLLDKIDDTAKLIGAVNTVVNKTGVLIGSNTDWLGVVAPLEQRTSLKGKKVAILGAGGSARAAAYGVAKKGAHLSIYNRTFDKAKVLADEFGGFAYSLDDTKSIKTADVIINTTSVGLDGLQNPISSELISSNQIVFDAVYHSGGTQLMTDAQKKGAKVIDGYEMLLHQGLSQFKLYTGRNAPEDALRYAIKKDL